MNAWALVVAAGSGTRFGGAKQFAELAGRPVLDWSLETARSACSGLVLVLPADRIDGASRWGADSVVAGGATRSASVRAGLEVVPEDATVIAVHDAARPLAPLSLWLEVIDAVRGGADAAVPSVPVSDTVKQIGSDGRLVTLDRSTLVAVQTPQAFRAEVLRAVHLTGADASDDAALVEAAGGKVTLVPAPALNLKITSPVDLVLAEALVGVRA
jgi:2-C-methyl-D-erythritol 4-phosphate cytidylyltransferase